MQNPEDRQTYKVSRASKAAECFAALNGLDVMTVEVQSMWTGKKYVFIVHRRVEYRAAKF